MKTKIVDEIVKNILSIPPGKTKFKLAKSNIKPVKKVVKK